MSKYAILVNTCDNFEDCWQPYFKLHAQYWPDCAAKLHLNTETKEFSYPGLDISVLKVAVNEHRRLTWSECLLRALDKIEDDIILYMQEDYFLNAPVKNNWVEKYVQLMNGDTSIHCIHLTDQAVIAGSSSQYDGLCKIKLKQRYRISCQAALWRKEVLKSYLRAHESAWQFEEFGSKRSTIMPHNFFVVNPALVKLNKFEIIPYVFTGIVQGRWKEEVVPLFSKHCIEVNYALRGFLTATPARTLSVKLNAFSKRLPAMLRSYLDLMLLTIQGRKNK